MSTKLHVYHFVRIYVVSQTDGEEKNKTLLLQLLPFHAGLKKTESKLNLGRRDSWINFPISQRLAVTTHSSPCAYSHPPTRCQGLRGVALSETIIRDFIIYCSSLRTDSSLQHANLLFSFQTFN